MGPGAKPNARAYLQCTVQEAKPIIIAALKEGHCENVALDLVFDEYCECVSSTPQISITCHLAQSSARRRPHLQLPIGFHACRLLRSPMHRIAGSASRGTPPCTSPVSDCMALFDLHWRRIMEGVTGLQPAPQRRPMHGNNLISSE